MCLDSDPCFSTPDGLTQDGLHAVEAIKQQLERWGMGKTGGEKVFYSPQEWQGKSAKGAVLIVCHSGDLAPIFNRKYAAYQGYRMHNDMQAALREEGLRAKQCTQKYSSIYRIRKTR